MKKSLLMLAAACWLAGSRPASAETAESRCLPEPVDAEVVFVLDTTGSMTGLIEGAKQKIWSIAGGIIQRTGGKVRIGLIPYRDRGDVYVTKYFPLTDNLDQVYSDLQSFRAEGGGDGPESVNQALHEAVTKIQWSESPRVMRTIFLVGDFPPHMDYPDDVKYPESCALAAKKNIVINTVQCGGEPSATPPWREIAKLTNGVYTQIGQSGNMRMIETPYDAEIRRINIEITETILPYGSIRTQAGMRQLVSDNVGASAAVAASRNSFKAKAGMAGSAIAAPVTGQDLTAEPELLEKLAPEDLPEEFRDLTPEARQAKLDEAVSRRRELNAKLLELDRKRSEYLRELEKSREEGAPASFDGEVLKSVESQLERLRSDSGDE